MDLDGWRDIWTSGCNQLLFFAFSFLSFPFLSFPFLSFPFLSFLFSSLLFSPLLFSSILPIRLEDQTQKTSPENTQYYEYSLSFLTNLCPASEGFVRRAYLPTLCYVRLFLPTHGRYLDPDENIFVFCVPDIYVHFSVSRAVSEGCLDLVYIWIFEPWLGALYGYARVSLCRSWLYTPGGGWGGGLGKVRAFGKVSSFSIV